MITHKAMFAAKQTIIIGPAQNLMSKFTFHSVVQILSLSAKVKGP